MATLQQQIQQAQATIQMLEQMVRARRASEQDVQQAKDRLASLLIPERTTPPIPLSLKQGEGVHRENVDRPVKLVSNVVMEPVAEPTGRRIDQDEYLVLQSELSKDADRLNRQMAELSNQLHKVPSNASCGELTRPILTLKAQIEEIWDKKRYLERNRCLPEEADDQEEATEENSPIKYELAYKKRRLIDLRYKLKDKLKNPAAKPGKVQEWREELARTNLEIAEIDITLGTL